MLSVRIVDPLLAEKIEIIREKIEERLEKRRNELAGYTELLNNNPEEGMKMIYRHVLSDMSLFAPPIKDKLVDEEENEELPDTGEFDFVHLLSSPKKITGLWDLPMQGGERYEVERAYQSYLSDERDRVNIRSYSNNGVFLRSPETKELYRLSLQLKAYGDNGNDKETEFLLTVPYAGFIPESISFCIRQKYLNDFISNQTDEKPTKESPKTANAKAEVIYSLIEYSFGKEVLKSLRTNLDNKIKAEFTRKGIELPATGQTIEKWLKDAGLIN